MKILCPKLCAIDLQNRAAVRAAFAEAPVMRMGQAWRAQTEEKFLPAEVRIGWHGDCLLVFGELIDGTPFTQATKDNQLLCALGDVFELFLRDVEGESYVEFHVAPNGRRLQLMFPSASAFQRVCNKEVALEDLMEVRPMFDFSQWAEGSSWCICASVPSSALLPQGTSLEGRTWRVSFSRYDYSSAEEPPVLSSTSHHAELSFHRQHEWTEVEFL